MLNVSMTHTLSLPLASRNTFCLQCLIYLLPADETLVQKALEEVTAGLGTVSRLLEMFGSLGTRLNADLNAMSV